MVLLISFDRFLEPKKGLLEYINTVYARSDQNYALYQHLQIVRNQYLFQFVITFSGFLKNVVCHPAEIVVKSAPLRTIAPLL